MSESPTYEELDDLCARFGAALARIAAALDDGPDGLRRAVVGEIGQLRTGIQLPKADPQ